MDVEALTARLLQHPAAAPSLLPEPLPDALAEGVVVRLKDEADRHWSINANISLQLADVIRHIGRKRDDQAQVALGMMARGDALKFLGRIDEAWYALEAASDLYTAAGDDYGWARTCIGRLYLSVNLNRVDEVLADAARARTIFTEVGDHERILRLQIQTGVVYNWRGDYDAALDIYRRAAELAESLGEAGTPYLGLIATNTGYSYNLLGDFQQAEAYYAQAYDIYQQRGATSMAALAKLNLGNIAQERGRYREALLLLLEAQQMAGDERPVEFTLARSNRMQCYLSLNRFAEARDLGRRVVADYREQGALYELGRALRHLAMAEAELGNYAAAQAALADAEPIFLEREMGPWIATLRQHQGQIALLQGNAAQAQQLAQQAVNGFDADSQAAHYAEAVLLHAQAQLALGDLAGAAKAGRRVLEIARQSSLPALRYSAYLLLGQVFEAEGRVTQAMRRYQAATATVERVQRGLTITLRPGFLEDKDEAQRRLIRLCLNAGQIDRAFETLEAAKSQTLLNLANQESLRWAQDNPATQTLVAELDQLRATHHWLYGLAYHQPLPEDASRPASTPKEALAQLPAVERRMRAITEQLYLHSGEHTPASYAAVPSLADIQGTLEDGTVLLEFYNDNGHLLAFTLDRAGLAVHPLPLTGVALNRLLAQLQFNLACALKVDVDSPATRNLTGPARQLLQRLYAGLLAPLASRIAGAQRLVVVPYGALHYLPFHLLYDGVQYLIENYEVVVLPAAGLATRRGPRRDPGALILAHSWNGHLPQTLREAEIVAGLVGGTHLRNDAATRAALLAPPRQVLHIAAHGEYRIDQPELSYIELADGQLYTDDLFQRDLSYELVTLSACETGRANVAAGDELIGLGRGFLYAGTGALLVSLWRVSDATTVTLMEAVYRGLMAGLSKAAALREAQLTILRDDAQRHPAYWGAFQLVGDAAPLSDRAGVPQRRHANG
jgi:CHAT domain-containing protein